MKKLSSLLFSSLLFSSLLFSLTPVFAEADETEADEKDITIGFKFGSKKLKDYDGGGLF